MLHKDDTGRKIHPKYENFSVGSYGKHRLFNVRKKIFELKSHVYTQMNKIWEQDLLSVTEESRDYGTHDASVRYEYTRGRM